MPFSAINTYEDEVRQRNERHTLELQLENAMVEYQRALEAQRLEDWESAHASYEKLFAFDVMRSKHNTERSSEARGRFSANSNDGGPASSKTSKGVQLGPALRLRAMALKNYAILLVSPETPPDEDIERALAYMGEALEIVGTDDKEKLVVGSLVQLLWALGDRRGTRLGVEMIVENDDGGSIIPLELWTKDAPQALQLLSPQSLNWLRALDFMVSTDSTSQTPVPKILRKFQHLSKPEEPLRETIEADSYVEISLPTKTWGGLVSALNDAVMQNARRYKRRGVNDPYAWSSRDLWSVKFTGLLLNRDQRSPVIETVQEIAEIEEPRLSTPERSASEPVALQSPLVSLPMSPAEILASPAKKRRTERLTRSASLALPADFGVADTNFAAQFNGFLSLSSAKDLIFMSPAYLFFEPSQDIPPQLAYAADLKDMLTTWDSRESAIFLTESTSIKPQKGGIMDTLRRDSGLEVDNFPDSPEGNSEVSDSRELESYEVENFVKAAEGSHIQQIRLDLGTKLLELLSAGGRTSGFGKMVFTFVDEIEGLLWSRRDFLSPAASLALFGLYTDQWLQSRSDETDVKRLRWQTAASAYGGIPYMWILSFLSQEDPDVQPESTIAFFENILSLDFDDDPHRFSHLSLIPALTRATAHMQISKFKAAAAFERVISAAGPEATGKDEDIKLLEAMLMPQIHEKPPSTSDLEFNAIQQFLQFAQPQFKMGLWYILLEKYEASGDVQKCLTGLTRIFVEAMEALDRGEPLLKTLSVAHDVGKRLVPLFERDYGLLETACTTTESNEVLTNVIKLLQTLQLFMLYDDAVNSNLLQKPVTPTWPKVASKFRELVALWWTIFYHYWFKSVSLETKSNSETVNDILSIIHERLGNLGYCAAADGCLLKLHYTEIVRIDWDGSFLDMAQCLRCRFGLGLSLYGEGSNHHAIPKELKQADALLILPFLMRMIMSRKNFNQVVMRTDTRTVLDAFTTVISADKQPDTLRRAIIEYYLSSDLSPKILKTAWQGKDCINTPQSSGDPFSGLWFVQAYVLLNQYRMRRRQAYKASSTRSEQLLAAADLFLIDLSTVDVRFESWVGLAQTYGYLCEDLLTFGAEVGTPEDAVDFCRRGLLAVMQALSIKVRSEGKVISQPEIHDSMSSALWPLIGNLLVLGVVPPLAMSPFSIKVPPRPFLVEMSELNKHRIGLQPQPQISARGAMSLAARCLGVSVDSQTDWINAITRSVAAEKAGASPGVVIEYIEKAIELEPSSNYDAESLMVEYLWYFYRDDKIDESTAREHLKRLNLGVDSALSVGQLIETSLKKLLEKVKWLHRPRYILARLYELDHKDTIQAQQELQQLFSLKSPTKPLVIWNVESELPGQHGVDMSQYLLYLSDLMVKNEDSAGIALLARRFRRNAMEMWNHSQTYEQVFTGACMLARKLLRLDIGQEGKLSDKLMANVVAVGPEKFEATTKAMFSHLGYTEETQAIQSLHYVSELRRLNSGTSSAAMADDILVTVFLLMLRQFEQDVVPSAALPTAVSTPTDTLSDSPAVDGVANSKASTKQTSKKKLLRKDVINAALQLLKPLHPKLAKLDEIGIPKGFIFASMVNL